MLFKVDTLQKIKKGSVTLAFRKWKRATVKQGGSLHTPIGLLKIEAIQPIEMEDITDEYIRQAGYDKKEDLETLLNSKKGGTLYKIKFHLEGPDPRIKLRENDQLSEEEIEAVLKKLERYDKSLKYGKWTQRVLEYIDQNPELRAADISEALNIEKDWLKSSIRKLKNLGLTISLQVGYRISPRGKVILARNAES